MGPGELNAWRKGGGGGGGRCYPAMDYHPIPGEVKILLVTLCYRNLVKFRPDGPLSS